jgi:hypothetical protein
MDVQGNDSVSVFIGSIPPEPSAEDAGLCSVTHERSSGQGNTQVP